MRTAHPGINYCFASPWTCSGNVLVADLSVVLTHNGIFGEGEPPCKMQTNPFARSGRLFKSKSAP